MSQTHTPSGATTRSWLRRLLVLAVIIAGLASVLTVSRPTAENWLLQRVQIALSEALVPDVHFDGPMHWRLQPVPTVALNQIRLQQGEHRLLLIESITLTLDAQALLDGNIVIDTVHITRPQLDLGDNPQHWLSPNAWLRDTDQGERSAPPIMLKHIQLEHGSLQAQLPEQHLALHIRHAELAMTLTPAISSRLALSGEMEYTGRKHSETTLFALNTSLDWDGLLASSEHFTLSLTPLPTQDVNSVKQLIPALAISATAQAWPGERRAELTISGKLSTSTFSGKITWNETHQRPFALQLHVDLLDLDHWLSDTPADDNQSIEELAPWRNWPLSADITIDRFRWQQMTALDARIRINVE